MLRKARRLLSPVILLAISAIAALPQIQPQSQEPSNVALPNGKWFNGTSFDARTAYSVKGLLTFQKPSRIDRTIDLAGLYIIPPFGNAHTHHDLGISEAEVKRYLEDGVFYVANMGNVPFSADQIDGRGLNRAAGLEMTFVNGQLTGRGGHPIGMVKGFLAAGLLPGYTEETLKDRRYFEIDSKADLERKWPLILSFHPDLIKVMLWNSDEFAKRRNDPAFFSRRGIDPELVPLVVEKAHGAGLRVAAHVTTAADVHNALNAGVDEIAHIPLTPITEQDAAYAAKHGIVVVTTCAMVSRLPEAVLPKSDLPKVLEAQVASLKLLHASHVPMAIGSDDPRDTSAKEFEYLQRLGVLDNLALLKMWTETTAKAIFPERRIGRLAEGYESSFLGLEGNPLEDLQNVRRIKIRFKKGFLLQP